MERVNQTAASDENYRVAASLAWSRAIRDFFHPPLPEPVIENMPGESSFFYIDSNSWTVHLNIAGVPLHLTPDETELFLISVCHHEIEHYLVCPFDGVMNGRMFTSARKHVNDATAMFVCNLFADLVVDSNLLRRFQSLTYSRITNSIHDSALRTQEHSDLWKLIITSYRVMWGFPIPPTVEIEQRTYSAANEIIRVARESIIHEQRWPNACEKIAKIISNWIPSDKGLPGLCPGASKDVSQESFDGTRTSVVIPLDVDGIMGSPIEVRNGDLARKCLDSERPSDVEEEMARLAIEVEQLQGSIEELQGVFLVAGVGSERALWTRFYYRAKAHASIRFELDSTESTGITPLTPEIWKLGDPLEELDFVQSLQAFPVLIPNRSTRKWQHAEMGGLTISKSPPDMLIVVDSSGSMTWAMGPTTISGDYHTALVAAFAAMDFAFRNGRNVSAINFSDGVQTSDWSRDRASAERTLLAYQGGGTVAPLERIAEMCEKAESDAIVLLITDAEISNWKQMVGEVERLSKRGHHIFLFHIGARTGSRLSKIHQILEKAGVSVYPLKSAKDLPGLVIKEMRSVYGKRFP
jgi:Mg-chelatase subunit ChlD